LAVTVELETLGRKPIKGSKDLNSSLVSNKNLSQKFYSC